MRIFQNVCRLAVGLLFIYSGFVKGIDPAGSQYKFIDYFHAFHLGWLDGSALFFSFTLSLAEFLTGLGLLLNLRVRWAAWGALLFMAVFTPLALVLALTNPVADCGCFGDAVTLSNWETFGKNVVLSGLVLVVFCQRKRFKPAYNFLEQHVLLLLGGILMLGIEIHCHRHLPLIDFRPYAIGKNIPEGMSIPPGAPHDEYEITLQYRNRQTGEVRDFTEEDYPWQDTLHWEYANSYERLVKKGYQAPIRDFIIEHPERGDITEEVLADKGYTFLAVSYHLEQADPSHQEELNRLAAYAEAQGHHFYGLTASLPEAVERYHAAHDVPYAYCTMDEIQLKTMIRSNPGLVLLHEGTILGKWSHRNLPNAEELQDKDLLAYILDTQRRTADKQTVYLLVLACTALLGCYAAAKHRRKR